MKNPTALSIAALVLLAGCSSTTSTSGPKLAESTSGSKGATSGDAKVTKTSAPSADSPISAELKFKHDGALYYGLTNPKPLTYTSRRTGMDAQTGSVRIRLVAFVNGAQTGEVTRTDGLADLGNDTIRVDKDGVWVTATTLGKFDDKVLEFPADVKPGQTWSQKASLTVGGKQTSMAMTLKAVGEESIKTALGDMKALKVTNEGSLTQDGKTEKVSGTTWYVKGTGMVKTTLSAQGQDFVIEVAK